MGWRYGEGGYNWSIWSYMKMKKIHFCVERRLCVSNKTEHKSLNKNTTVARGQDGVYVKSMIDPVLIKKNMWHYG